MIDALSLQLSSVTTILDSLDALVYVSDMQTYELIFMNKYGAEIWGSWRGKRCWQVLQSGQEGPCSFCNNHLLLNPEGQSTGIVVWEFQNSITGCWYQCRDQAIPWVDGRTVRIEIAFDITERKNLENELRAAHQQAEQLALTDPLTELKNRRAFFDEVNQLFSRSLRFSRPFCVAMIDVDYFKRINDRYGHVAGDKVLRRVAEAIRASVRDVDLPARIGGEEFGVILPETRMIDALSICERIRKTVASLNIPDMDALTISCSIGIASSEYGYQSFDGMITDADHALYKAKNGGRNRIECKI